MSQVKTSGKTGVAFLWNVTKHIRLSARYALVRYSRALSEFNRVRQKTNFQSRRYKYGVANVIGHFSV